MYNITFASNEICTPIAAPLISARLFFEEGFHIPELSLQ
jgi:hypothetical protein